MIQPITYLIPLRYFVIILRGIFLKGVGLETLWPQALALLCMGRGNSDPRGHAIEQAAGLKTADGRAEALRHRRGKQNKRSGD